MASNSVVTASIPNAAKDLGKKKRANRSAKLKQCKLDARREQWLSHVRNKTCKDDRTGIFSGEIHNPSTEVGEDKSEHQFEDLEARTESGENNYGLIHLESDSESPANSTSSSSVSGGNELGNSYNVGDSSSSSSSLSCSSSSSFGSGGSCSGSITEEEENEGGGDDDDEDDGCLDDWEAVADALAADEHPIAEEENEGGGDDDDEDDGCLDDWEAVADALAADEHPIAESATEKEVVAVIEKPKLENAGLGMREVASTHVWRADDAFRPKNLPSLLKQNSFPMNSEKYSGRGINPWGHSIALSVPTSCPICYEDLDITDSSFLPCICGFRLCLFCHKRILEGDCRCPGCRKPYELDAMQKQVSVNGESASIRFARSCSMFSRT